MTILISCKASLEARNVSKAAPEAVENSTVDECTNLLDETACETDTNQTLEDKSELESEPVPSTPPPIDIQLTSSTPLIKVQQVLDEAISTTVSASVPTGSGYAATNRNSTVDTDIYSVDNPAATASDGIDMYVDSSFEHPKHINPFGSYFLPFTIQITTEGASTTGCAFDQPYSTLSCDIVNPGLNSEEILSDTVSLNIETSINDLKTSSKVSTTLDQQSYTLRQITNTTGDNSTNDIENIDFQKRISAKIFFPARNTAGVRKLFYYDSGTTKVIEASAINAVNVGDVSQQKVAHVRGDWIYFIGVKSGAYSKLYRFNATSSALEQISNTNPSSGDFFYTPYFINHGDKIYYNARDMVSDTTLLSFDTVSNQIFKYANIEASANDVVSPHFFAIDGNNLAFAAAQSINIKLFRLDEPGNTISQISNTYPGSTDFPIALDFSNGSTYYYLRFASGDSHFTELDSQNKKFTIINNTNILSLHNVGSRKITVRANTSGANKLSEYISTTDSYHPISNTSGDMTITDSPVIQGMINDVLIFTANNSQAKEKLWTYNATTNKIAQVSNLSESSDTDDNISTFYIYNNKYFFEADNKFGATKLFVYDPVKNQVSQISNLSGDQSISDDISSPLLLEDRVIFKAVNPSGGRKLFSLCDHSLGCE